MLIDFFVFMLYCKLLDIFIVGGLGDGVVINSVWEIF